MTFSPYLIKKIARHGSSVTRLSQELEKQEGKFSDHSPESAIAFDAADFVWAFLCLQGHEGAQDSRYIRNRIAEQIIEILESAR